MEWNAHLGQDQQLGLGFNQDIQPDFIPADQPAAIGEEVDCAESFGRGGKRRRRDELEGINERKLGELGGGEKVDVACAGRLSLDHRTDAIFHLQLYRANNPDVDFDSKASWDACHSLRQYQCMIGCGSDGSNVYEENPTKEQHNLSDTVD